MKKTTTVILTLALCAALLCGCGKKGLASDGNASDGNAYASYGNATDGNAFATDGDALATDGDAAEPSALPLESEGNEPNAPVDPAALLAVLEGIQKDYQPGTAGCSLTAARLAGEVMDAYLADDMGLIAAAEEYGDPGTDEFGVAYVDRLGDIYATAMSLYGQTGKDLLESAGYVTEYGSYAAGDVRAIFETLYAACGQTAPTLIRVFRSDDQAERFLVSSAQLESLTAENVLRVLQGVEVLNADVKVNAMTQEDGVIKLDLSAELLPQLQQFGTSGEYMLLGALVNTYLSAFDAAGLLLTVDGQAPETGHNVYDYELGYYADNVAVE